MILSVCIGTVPQRSKELAIVRAALGMPNSDWELVIDDRPREAVSIGQKRQDMSTRCVGAYIVHIDDDDLVPSDYVATILQALSSGPDCIGHFELVEGLSPTPQLSKWTKNAPGWLEGPKAQRYGVSYVRTTFHKTPVKAEHVKAVGFKDMRFGEDHDFSKRLMASGFLKSEVFIPRVMYTYRYTHEEHNAKYGIR